MTITAKHNRIAVGLRLEGWTVVYYEPIDPPQDLATPHCTPDIGLYSHSRGDANEDDPMFGEVAWEPLLNHAYIKCDGKAGKLRLQRRALYDAWRYLAAKDPAEIDTIREQLQGSTISSTTSEDEQGKRERMEQGLPAESVEKDEEEEDSGLGSGIEDGEDDEGVRMPPPPPPRFHRQTREPSGFRASQPFRSGSREESLPVEGDDYVAEVVRTGGNAAISRTRGSASASASGFKRRREDGNGTRSPRGRTGGSDRSGLFMTPEQSQAQWQSHTDDDDRHESGMPGSSADPNNGLDDDAALAAGIRASMAPENPSPDNEQL